MAHLLVQPMHPTTVFFPLIAYCGVFPKDLTMILSFNILRNAYIFLITLITVGKHSNQLYFNVDKGRKGVGANQVSFMFRKDRTIGSKEKDVYSKMFQIKTKG